MAFKMLIVVGSCGFKLNFAKKLAKEAAGLGAKACIVFVGNSLYDLRIKRGHHFEGIESVAIMAHKMGLAERGISAMDIAKGASIIDDDQLLELMIESEKTICI